MEVSETVTIITTLMDTIAYPARDIAELYGMRWASELVYLEKEKQTLAGGQPVTAATPAGAYRWPPPPSPPTRRCGSPAPASPRRSAPSPPGSAPPRCAARSPPASRAGQGATASALSAAIEITRRDITAHPLRLVTAWRPGRHYPRFTIKKVRARKSNDVVPAATRLHLLPLPATPGPQQPNAPPGLTRARSPSPAPAAPGHRHAWHRRSPAGQGLPGHRSPSSRASHTDLTQRYRSVDAQARPAPREETHATSPNPRRDASDQPYTHLTERQWGHSGVKMSEVDQHLDETYFAWMGAVAGDGPFYYRVHSPVVLIEFDHHPGVAFDNVVPSRNHIHTVVRTPNGGDYGLDLLRQHHDRFDHSTGIHIARP